MKNLQLIPLGLALMTASAAFAADEIHYTLSGKNSVTFDWRGTAAENSIGFGLTPGAYTQVKAINPKPTPKSSKGPFWEAKLTGLKENTVYYYAIGNGPERSFRTAPALGSSGFTVYAQGDIGDTSHSFNTGAVQDIIADAHPAFVFGLGDLTLGSINGKEAVDQHFNDVMSWSKEAAYMPVWGDQDWKKGAGSSLSDLKGRFNLPNPQFSPGSPLSGNEDWYWFDYGNVRFIALPEPWSGAAWSDWKTKADVLMGKAQADSNIKFIVTMAHRAAYSSGHFTGSVQLKEILNALGDRYSKYALNLNAHSTNYERSLPQHGVVHITAGTGGSNLKQDGDCLWLTCAKPEWSAFRTMHHGALKLNFTASNIQGSFICGPSGGGKNDINCAQGSVMDSFTITPSAPIAKPSAPRPHAKKSEPKADATSYAVMQAGATSCTQKTISTSKLILDGGYAYRVNGIFGGKADNKTATTQSALRLFENGVEIGPAHTGHPTIRSTGKGRFSHWSLPDGTRESIRWSATNNSNPKTNGKKYTYCFGTSTAAPSSAPAQAPTPAPAPAPSSAPAPTAESPTTPASTSCAAAPTSSLVVNVKDKGAQGNGSANDTAAIQAAINQVAGTGGTVLIPSGTYLINTFNNRLFLKSNMTFRMASGALLKAITTDSPNYSLLRAENISNVNIIGGKLQGDRYSHQGTSGEWGHGVHIVGVNNVVVENMISADMWGDGFYIGKNSTKVTACSITADNNRRQGMSITDADGVVVKNSVFKNSNGVLPEAGIQIEPNQNETVNNVKILNSQALNNKGYGIKLTIPNAYLSGSLIKGVTLDHNTVTGNTYTGIVVAKTSGNWVTNNIVKDNVSNGIDLLAGAANNNVTGNTVTNNGGSGNIGILMWDRATRNTVTNNTVSGHQKANIKDYVGGNTISPNTVN